MQMADVQYHREGERGKTLGFFDRQRALEFRSWLCKRKREGGREGEKRGDPIGPGGDRRSTGSGVVKLGACKPVR